MRQRIVGASTTFQAAHYANRLLDAGWRIVPKSWVFSPTGHCAVVLETDRDFTEDPGEAEEQKL